MNKTVPRQVLPSRQESDKGTDRIAKAADALLVTSPSRNYSQQSPGAPVRIAALCSCLIFVSTCFATFLMIRDRLFSGAEV
eukprot:1289118-Amphidinium_carterae.1